MELADTIKLMNSDNYKDRFKAEYYQLQIRTDKLINIFNAYEEGILDFELATPYHILREQYLDMYKYLQVLKQRAEMEGIEI